MLHIWTLGEPHRLSIVPLRYVCPVLRDGVDTIGNNGVGDTPRGAIRDAWRVLPILARQTKVAIGDLDERPWRWQYSTPGTSHLGRHVPGYWFRSWEDSPIGDKRYSLAACSRTCWVEGSGAGGFEWTAYVGTLDKVRGISPTLAAAKRAADKDAKRMEVSDGARA